MKQVLTSATCVMLFMSAGQLHVAAQAGPNQSVQFNDTGVPGGDSGFLYDKSMDTAYLTGALVCPAVKAADALLLDIDSDNDGTAMLALRSVVGRPGIDFDNDGTAEIRFTSSGFSGPHSSWLELVPDPLVQGMSDDSTGRVGVVFYSRDEYQRLALMTNEHSRNESMGLYLRGSVDLDSDGTIDADTTSTNSFWAYYPGWNYPTTLPRPGYLQISFAGLAGNRFSFVFEPHMAQCASEYPGEPQKWGGITAGTASVCIADILKTGQHTAISDAWYFSKSNSYAQDYGLTIDTASRVTRTLALTDGSALAPVPSGPIESTDAAITSQFGNIDSDSALENYVRPLSVSDPFDYSSYGGWEFGVGNADLASGEASTEGALRIMGGRDLDSDSTFDSSERNTYGEVVSNVGPIRQILPGWAGSLQLNAGISAPQGGAQNLAIWAKSSSGLTLVVDLDNDGTTEAADACLRDAGVDADCDGSAETTRGATTHGTVMWGSSNASFNTGTKVCSAHGLACQGSASFGGAAGTCSQTYATNFIALCY